MIDLDALAKDLLESGFAIKDFRSSVDGVGLEVYPSTRGQITAVVRSNGSTNLWISSPNDWSLADIIRRHIEGAK